MGVKRDEGAADCIARATGAAPHLDPDGCLTPDFELMDHNRYLNDWRRRIRHVPRQCRQRCDIVPCCLESGRVEEHVRCGASDGVGFMRGVYALACAPLARLPLVRLRVVQPGRFGFVGPHLQEPHGVRELATDAALAALAGRAITVHQVAPLAESARTPASATSP
eukprot:scaffold199082_cov22-Tisochrysis_lutea.AAC.2